MALTEAEFDRIEAFLEGTLSPNEERQLEEDLARDPDFREAFEEHRVIWEGLQVPGAVAYFQDLHTQLDQQGLLDDDVWVEASPSDDTATDSDEPEVFVAEDPASSIDVAVHDDSDPDSHPKAIEGPDAWDTDPPQSSFDDSDPY